jgi:hypothetical protein
MNSGATSAPWWPNFEKTGYVPPRATSDLKDIYYITFEKIDDPSIAMDYFQLPKSQTDAKLRVKLDTMQIADDLNVPLGHWQEMETLEPYCKDWPISTHGIGGGTQAYTKSSFKVIEIDNLVTGDVKLIP